MNKKNTCPICKFKNGKKIKISGSYTLLRCDKCEMVWDSKSYFDLEGQYKKDYFSNNNPKGGYANYFEGMAVNKRTFSDRLRKIEKLKGKKGRMLDVGCALGDCLLEARSLGWKDISGIELSDYASKFARNRGLKVIKGKLSTVSLPKKFDVVMMQDVIEHVPDPIEDLKIIHSLLNSKGLLYLVTPDIGGMWSKVLGPMWYHYKRGEHIMYFSQQSITKALSEAGFKNIKTARTYHVMSVEYILNRMKYYSPIFGLILNMVKATPIKKIPFRVYAGELEAWGEK